jgi:iron complex transport system ATP-binding protein
MENSENILLELVNIGLGYTRHTDAPVILAEDLSLKVRAGEIIGLIGRNGCGKSTLLRTLVKLQSPLKGRILIEGREINHIHHRDYAKTVGFVSTENITIQHSNVTELVSLGRFPYTNWLGAFSEDDKKAVNNAISLVGIEHLRKKYLHELSDGERQKTMIARVLAQDTKMVILDEPTAFLDLPNRYDILRLLNELAHKSGKTVIYSTHDLNIALYESDKLWLMTAGGIIEGAPEDLIITKGFHKLFENSGLDFDINTAEFRLKRNFTGSIRVSGEPELNVWTIRSLERIGIETVKGDSDLGLVTTGYQHEKPVWTLQYHDESLVFVSVYDLLCTLKKLHKTNLN